MGIAELVSFKTLLFFFFIGHWYGYFALDPERGVNLIL